MKSPSRRSARVTKASSASVTPRQADSTTASRGFGEASSISATRRKQPASATLEPPNLCTIQPFHTIRSYDPNLEAARNFNRSKGRLASDSVPDLERIRLPLSRAGAARVWAGPCAAYGSGKPARPLQGLRAGRAHRLIGRNEMLFAVADQVGAAHALQRFAQDGPVVGIVIAQKRLVQAAHLDPFGTTTSSLLRVMRLRGFLPE
jgi:hypothetical protein